MCGNACGGCKRSEGNVSSIVPMRVVGELVDMMAILMTEELHAALYGLDDVLKHQGNNADSTVTYVFNQDGSDEITEKLDINHDRLSQETLDEVNADLNTLRGLLDEIDQLAGNPQKTVQLTKVLLKAGRLLGL